MKTYKIKLILVFISVMNLKILIAQPPTCTYTWNAPICVNTPVTYVWTGTSPDTDPGLSNTIFVWSLPGSNHPIVSGAGYQYATATVIYSTPGAQQVTLSVYCQSWCYNNPITISVGSPATVTAVCSRVPTGNVQVGTPVQFSSNGSFTTCGTIIDCTWDFGDGSPLGHGYNIQHTYVMPGTFTVHMVATNDVHTTSAPCDLTVEVLANPQVASNTPWTSVSTPTGNYQETGNAIATDPSGNSYITGFFSASPDHTQFTTTTNTVDFGNGNTATAVNSNVNPDDNIFFIAKYNSSSVITWLKTFTITDNTILPLSIKVDHNGDVYVAGYFNTGSATDHITINGTNLNGWGGFLLKLNSVSVVQWVRGLSSTTGTSPYNTGVDAMEIDPFGGIYLLGGNPTTVDIDNGSSTTQLSSSGFGRDVMLVKYNTAGTLMWAQSYGGNVTHNFLRNDWASLTYTGSRSDIKTDNYGNCYIIGSFSGEIAVGNTHVSNGGTDILIAKFSPAGQVVWSDQAGGSNDDYGAALTLNRMGQIYMTGGFKGTLTLGLSTLTSVDDQGWLGKYDETLPYHWIWSKNIGQNDQNNNIYIKAIDIDCSNHVYVGGNFFGNFPADNFNYINGGAQDFFIAKYDASNGNNLLTMTEGGAEDVGITDMAVDDNGVVHATGWYQSTVTFQPLGTRTATLGDGFNWFSTGTGEGPDIFLATFDGLNGVCCPVHKYECGDIYPSYNSEAIYIYAGNVCASGYTTVHSGNGNTVFNAATEVALMPGFTAENGSDFRAYIDPCSNGSQRLDNSYENPESSTFISEGLKIIPNPSSNTFKLYLTGAAEFEMKIFGVDGKQVFERKNIGSENYFEFGNELTAGVYFVHIIANNELHFAKIIKVN